MTSKELSCLAAEVAAEKKAYDIVVVEVDTLLEVTDFFVIATAANRVQAQAIVKAVEDALRDCGRKPMGREGLEDGQWSLLDYGDFVIDIFLPEAREFYRLENLWGDAPRVETEATIKTD